jgi:succinoglycan biosynthesis protein ExoM
MTVTGLTIGLLTFRRPDDLRAALPMLIDQADEVSSADRHVSVLVVDNDPAGSGRAVVEEMASPVVRYVVEPTPGIAAARNRVLDEAGDATFLVFIDDDERPHPGWLRLLLETQARTGAAVVAGAVVSEFSGPLDRWISAGGFFQRRRLPTGTPIDVAATNNLLLDMAAVRATGVRFDPAFGLSGGSDTLFTRQLGAAGYPMVWCDEAVVTDHVPVARMSRQWVLRRSFRMGNSVTRVDLVLSPTPWSRTTARCRALVRGLPRIGGGVARWLVGGLTGRVDRRAGGLRTAARGAGMLIGAFGVVYREYTRSDAVPQAADSAPAA